MPSSNVLDMPRGLHMLAGTAITLCAGLMLTWTFLQVRAEQQEVQAGVAAQRLQQIERAAGEVDQDFDDVTQDLEFAARAVRIVGDRELEDTLAAMLAMAKPYRMAVVFDSSCQAVRVVQDPKLASLGSDTLDLVNATAKEACDQGSGVYTSLNLTIGTSWYRVFARDLDGPGSGSLALLVDTRPMLQQLQAVTADQATELLVLGPHGLPVPVSNEVLAAAVQSGGALAAWSEVVASMRRGESGTRRLPANEATALGFPDADVLAVWVPIAGEEGVDWSAAALVSTVHLGRPGALWRIGFAGIVGTVLLLALAIYVAAVSRRDAQTSERLRSALSEAHLRERAELLLDHVPSWVIAFDAQLAVVTANRAMEERHGVKPGEALSELFQDAPPLEIVGIETLLELAMATGEVQRRSESLHLFGAAGRFEVRAIPIRSPATDERVLLVIDDMTALYQLQERLVRAEKLSTVGVLAAGIAHEVGTPLGVIRGRAEYAGEKLGEDHPQAAGLKVIVEQIDRIVRVISGLLDFASPRAVEADVVDLSESVQRVLALVDYEILRRKQRVDLTMPDGVQVAGNTDQVEQIVLNLLMNAIHASPDGGVVEVSAEQVGDSISLVVRDHGCGIAHDDLTRVFDPFFTTKKRGVGTGLGLAVVHQLVRAHGGSVQLSSEVQQGTRVEVLLPHARVDLA